MLNTSLLEEVYEEMMDAWWQVHGGIPTDRCDLCGELSTGVLYNLPGGDGKELLVCYNCYIGLSRQVWRES